jgi:hypothetical protein
MPNSSKVPLTDYSGYDKSFHERITAIPHKRDERDILPFSQRRRKLRIKCLLALLLDLSLRKHCHTAFLALELPPSNPSSTLACLRQLDQKAYPGSRESLGSPELRIEQAGVVLTATRCWNYSCRGHTSWLHIGFNLRVPFTGSLSSALLFGLFTRSYCTRHSVYIYGPS